MCEFKAARCLQELWPAFKQQFPFFPEGCLCLAMQDQRSTKPATDTEPDPQCITSCLHLDSAEWL